MDKYVEINNGEASCYLQSVPGEFTLTLPSRYTTVSPTNAGSVRVTLSLSLEDAYNAIAVLERVVYALEHPDQTDAPPEEEKC